MTVLDETGTEGGMCGRYALHASPQMVAELLSLDEIEDFPPRYNIAPTQPILIIAGGHEQRPEANRSGRQAFLARWGLIPSWVKDASKFPLLFNARAETAATKNSFRPAMTYRRGLIPATEFYEWRRRDKAKGEPFMMRADGNRPFAFAGLFETAHGPDGGEIDTAAIVTMAADGPLAAIHERMPVVVEETDYERWLDCRSFGPADVIDIVTRSAASRFEVIPIGEAVNAVANMGPDIQVRTEPAEGSATKSRNAARKAPGDPKSSDAAKETPKQMRLL